MAPNREADLTIVEGLECGDEGKGKLAHYLSKDKDVAAGGNGGINAGHSVECMIDKVMKTFKLSLLPAACLREHPKLVLGRGKMLNLRLLDELGMVEREAHTHPIDRLYIAPEAHISLMAQSRADGILEEWRGDGKIGTTGNGIGPGYGNKSLRIGMRIEELKKNPVALKDRYLVAQRYAKKMFSIVLASNEEDEEVAKLLIARSVLGPRVVEDMTKFWAKEIAAKSRILAECSQGYDLHIDGPRYPNVTSSQTNAHGQLNGLQIPRAFGNRAKLVGCIKAYNTFVGSGHSRTRMPDDVRARIQQVGKERGTITGRWRETNWLDLEKLQGGPMANENPDSIAMMKLDVYDNEPEIKVAVGSNDDGSPVYVTFPGWMQSTRGIQNFKDLPAKACDYIDFVERALQCPIHFIGTGPSEDDMIDRRPKS